MTRTTLRVAALLLAVAATASAAPSGPPPIDEWKQHRHDPSFQGQTLVSLPEELFFRWVIPSIVGGPVTMAGRLFQSQPEVIPGTGVLAARSIANGKLEWSQSIFRLVSRQPAAAEGLVFVASSDLSSTRAVFQAYDAATGDRLWAVDATGSATLLTGSEIGGNGRWITEDHEVSVPYPGMVQFQGVWHPWSPSTPMALTFDAADGKFDSSLTCGSYETPRMVKYGQSQFTITEARGPVTVGGGPPFCVCLPAISWTSYSENALQTDKGKTTLNRIRSADISDPGTTQSVGPCGASCSSVTYGLGARYGSPFMAGSGYLISYAGGGLAARSAPSPDALVVWNTPSIIGSVDRVGQFGAYFLAVIHGGGPVVHLNKFSEQFGTVAASASAFVGPGDVTISGGLAVTSNRGLFGDTNGVLHVIDLATMQEKQRIVVSSSPVMGDVVVVGQDVLVSGGDGILSRLSASGFECGAKSTGYPQNGHQAIGPGGINTLSGNLVFSTQDVSIPFAGVSFEFLRTYNSQEAIAATQFSASGTIKLDGQIVAGTPFESPLGPGWTHNFNVAVRPMYDRATGATLYVENRWDGRQVGYTHTLNGETDQPPGITDVFSTRKDSAMFSATTIRDSVSLQTKFGVVRDFDTDGALLRVRDPIGNSLSFTYTPTSVFKTGTPGVRLIAVVYASTTIFPPGAIVMEPPVTATVATFSYDSNARLAKIRHVDQTGTGFIETLYAYDTNGLLSDVTGSQGIYHAHYEYDSDKQMVLKQDPRQPARLKHLRFEYDLNGRVFLVKPPSAGAEIARYDYLTTYAMTQQTTVTTPVAGGGYSQVVYVFDECETLVETRDGLGGTARMDWDTRLNTTRYTDAGGNATRMEHDARGNLTRSIDPLAGQTLYEYEPAFNNTTRFVDANGHETRYAYDSLGNRTSEIRIVPAVLSGDTATQYHTRHTYESRGLRISTTDAGGGETFHTYDQNGNLKKTIQRVKSGATATEYTTTYSYDGQNRKIGETNARGVGSTWDYDAEGRLIRVRTGIAAGATAMDETTYQYDQWNRLTKETDIAGRFVEYTYNDRDEQITVTDTMSQQTHQTYDPRGNRISTTDPNGHKTEYTFDFADRLVLVKDAMNGTARYTYDPNGNLIAVVDPNNNTTTHQYDANSRRTLTTHPGGTSEQSVYDAGGNMIQRQYIGTGPGSLTITNTFDALNRLRRIQYGDGTPEVRYDLDSSGNPLLTKTQVLGDTYDLLRSFDTLSRPTKEVLKIAGTITATKTMEYDATGNRMRYTADAAQRAGIEHEVASIFDPLNRVTSLTSRGRTIAYEYAPNCLCGSKTQPAKITRPNGVETVFAYDAATRLLSLRHLRGDRRLPLAHFSYTYDPSGNRLTMRDIQSLHQYGYDSLDRLTSADQPIYADQTYQYDPSGNRTAQTVAGQPSRSYTYNALNQLTKVQSGTQTTTYTWDIRGNQTSRSSGAGFSASTTLYFWDGANRLAKVEGPGVSIEYGYDASGQRVRERVVGRDRWTVYDGLSPVLELSHDKGPLNDIVPGVMKTRLDTAEPLTEWYLNDGLGSVSLLVDELGNSTAKYFYDPFGATINVQNDPFNRLRFVGLQHDDATGLIYMNARWYDAGVGRFLGSDIESDDHLNTQMNNRYTYAMSNPHLYRDPTGWALCKIDLPGLGSSILDDEFSPKVKKWIELNKADKVNTTFTSAFRSRERQRELKDDPKAITPAETSLHEAGFAVDIDWNGPEGVLKQGKKESVLKNADSAGLLWGGKFLKPDTVHFYRDPGGREDKIKKAQEEYKKGVSSACP